MGPDRHVIILMLLCVSSAYGQPEPAAADPAAGEHALSGPKVEEDPAGPSALIERDFEGKMRPLEERPEVIAARRLQLTPTQWAPVQRVLDERAAKLDELVRENLDLLIRAQTVKASGDAAEGRKLLWEAAEAIRPLLEQGSLASQIHAALPDERRTEFDEINREIWKALVSERSAEAKAQGKGALGAKISGSARASLEVLGQEIRRAYDRIVSDGAGQIDRIIAELGLTPEQEGKVRALITEHVQRTKLKPSEADRLKLFADIARELTPAQRQRLRKLAQAR